MVPTISPAGHEIQQVLGSALNPTGTLSRRHLEQLASAIDDFFFRNCSISHLNTLIWLFMQPRRGSDPRDPQDLKGG